MRISELSAAAGVPLPTIKYYLREGLLPAGERTARNQARYGPEHLTRLRLICALVEVGNLRVGDARTVLAALDDTALSMSEVLQAAHCAMILRVQPKRVEPEWSQARDIVLAVAAQRGWRFDTSAVDQAADAIAAILATGGPHLHPLIDLYAEFAERMADHEIAAALLMGTPDERLRAVAIGSVFGEVLLNALRLMAQQSAAKTLLEPVKP